MKNTAVILALVAGLAAGTAACGSSDGTKATKGARTVEIEMHDLAYQPADVKVKAGETVRFVFHNQGKITHDAFLGDESAQMDHEREMNMSGMHHKSGDGITVAPGKTGDLTHTFKTAQSVLVGCHQSGHYAAGMKLTVDVT
jgi:uncharacterized cupredoxin-like copper-binding protein